MNHCWGISSLTQTIQKQIWSQSELNALAKQSKERYRFSDVLRWFLNGERWSRWRCQQAFPNEFRGRRSPRSSSSTSPVIPVPAARRIPVPVPAAAVFVHALHAELSSSTSIPRSATTEDTTSIRRQSSGPTAARFHHGPNPPRRWSMMSSIDFPPVVIIFICKYKIFNSRF